MSVKCKLASDGCKGSVRAKGLCHPCYVAIWSLSRLAPVQRRRELARVKGLLKLTEARHRAVKAGL